MFAIDQVTNEYDNNNDILDENKSEAESSKEKEPKKIRKWFLKIITSPWFERVSMFVIILNCITLGMYKPCEDQPKCTSTRCLPPYLVANVGYFIELELDYIINVL